MTKINEIIFALETLAPPDYQESYDNAGLIVGDKDLITTGILISLDVTEAVVDEAIAKNCNLIVAHHPIIFKGLKKLTGSNYIERTVIKAIKNNIAIYAIHTNLDNVSKGVNWKISNKLGLQNIQILAPKKQLLQKLTTYVPIENTQHILNSLFEAGAGEIGEYKNCSFSLNGTGTFKPSLDANPVVGSKGVLERVNETRIEIMFPSYLSAKIISTLQTVHPYETVAYYLQNIENSNQEVGSGAIGELPSEVTSEVFLALLKENMKLKTFKHTSPLDKKIKKIAVCGGSGSFLLNKAIRANADVFITSDFKYHEYFDAENKIMICDIGHYESEVFTKDLLHGYLSGIFSNFALCLSDTNTNPVLNYI